MKPISRLLHYQDELFERTMPAELHVPLNPDNDYPVFIKHDVLPRALCDQWAEEMQARGYTKDATVNARAYSSNEISDRIDENQRKTKYLYMTPAQWALYDARMAELQPEIEAFFNLSLRHNGERSALGYGPGDHFVLHADNATVETDDQGRFLRWKPVDTTRAISTILYLTDSVLEITAGNECIGGNLSFPFLQGTDGEPFLIEPRKGLFIAFPSNPVFSHWVHEVHEGYRVSIVSWYDRRR